MAWSKRQKAIVAAAFDAIGAGEMRDLVLRNLPGQRAMHGGRITSTSPKLTQDDFEAALARIEPMFEGGAVRLCRADGEPWFVKEPGHFQAMLDGDAGRAVRLRWKARRVDATLADGIDTWRADDTIRSWCRRQTAGRTEELEAMDWRELQGLLNALTAWARRHSVQLIEPQPT
ncbi:MAG: hypothetical protein AAFY08_14395 [Planctomycetota bacterium]